jgi:hypothetical protein
MSLCSVLSLNYCYAECHNTECLLIINVFNLGVLRLIDVMLKVVMMNVFMQNVAMLTVIMLVVIMLHVIMKSVVMLSVIGAIYPSQAPFWCSTIG